MSEQTLKFRTSGLPADADPAQYVGFSSDGRAFVLKWSSEYGCWGAAGWEVTDYDDVNEDHARMLPVVIACREEMAGFIVSHVRLAD